MNVKCQVFQLLELQFILEGFLGLSLLFVREEGNKTTRERGSLTGITLLNVYTPYLWQMKCTTTILGNYWICWA